MHAHTRERANIASRSGGEAREKDPGINEDAAAKSGDVITDGTNRG